MTRKVFIIGAGYAGIEAALTLQKKKKKNEKLEINIIDKNPYHTLLTELHEVSGNRISEDGIIISLRKIFEYSDVNVIQDEVAEVQFENQVIEGKYNNYEYDYLILAVGSEPNYFGIEGMKENAMPFWSYDESIAVKNRILEMFQKAKLEKNPKVRRKYLTFAIGGGGFTGTELAGELSHWSNQLAVEYGIDRDEVRIVILEAHDTVLTILDQKLIDKSVAYMTKKLGIEIITSSFITKVTPDSVFVNETTEIPASTFVWTGGVKANECFNNLVLKTGQGARVCVDEYTRTQYGHVYAVGDFSLFMTKEGKPLPALVESAMQTGIVAAKNILNDIRGIEAEECKPNLHGVMVSFGHKYAVAQFGNIRLSGIVALIMKHLINIHYLFGIGGFEATWAYIEHEWFHQRHGNYFLHNHLKVLTPNFWLTILRVYLGYKWLMEGVTKYNDGWFEWVMLAGSGGGTDANTGASVMQLVSSHTPGVYAWFVDTIIVPNAMLFQKFVVLTEIGLGLAFLSGSFVFLAALVSIVMNLNFLISTGLNDLWYLVVSIAMLGGAGRTFGIDHYLMPYLSKQWRYFVRNRRISLTLKKSKK